MFPEDSDGLVVENDLYDFESMNYKMNLKKDVVQGYLDDLKSMEQVVYKILNTERYAYNIYSWDYGIELEDLFGESITYVCPELERRITEALMQDDRIESVSNFEFDTSTRGVVVVSFLVGTVFGSFSYEKEMIF